MNPETKQLLCRFDEPGAFEFPAGFDYPDLERARDAGLRRHPESRYSGRFPKVQCTTKTRASASPSHYIVLAARKRRQYFSLLFVSVTSKLGDEGRGSIRTSDAARRIEIRTSLEAGMASTTSVQMSWTVTTMALWRKGRMCSVPGGFATSIGYKDAAEPEWRYPRLQAESLKV